MGKREAQRPKRTPQAASSSRTSENFASSGFIGFSTVSSGMTTTSEQPSAEHISLEEQEQALVPELRVIFRRFHKKDGVTKTKALDELTALISNTDTDVTKVVEAIPVWSHYFKRLCTENDWKTRLAVHTAHSAVAVKTKKHFSKKLKDVMGPWILGMNDSSTAVSQAAIRGFQQVFQVPKRADAVVFARKEVFAFLMDILGLVEDEKTIVPSETKVPIDPKVTGGKKGKSSGKKGEKPEVEIEKEPWLLSTAMKSLGFILQICPDSSNTWKEDFQGILSSKKFLKLGRHPSATVAISFLQLITSICLHCPKLINECVGLIPVLLLALEPSTSLDLTGSPVTWEALLAFLRVCPEFWKQANHRKVFFIRMATFLRKAGRNHAVTVYPSLLPLVSLFPTPTEDQQIVEETITFVTSLKTGLDTPSCKSSSSESVAVIKALFEVCLYLVKNETRRNENTTKLIVDEVLVPLALQSWEICGVRDTDFIQDEVVKFLYSAKNINEVTEPSWKSIGESLMVTVQHCDLSSKEQILSVAKFISKLAHKSPSMLADRPDILQVVCKRTQTHLEARSSLLSLPLLLALSEISTEHFQPSAERLANLLVGILTKTRPDSLIGITPSDALNLLFKLTDVCEELKRKEMFENIVRTLPVNPFLTLILQDSEKAQRLDSSAVLQRLETRLRKSSESSDGSPEVETEIDTLFSAAFGGDSMSLPRSALNQVVMKSCDILTDPDSSSGRTLRLCQALQSVNASELVLCPDSAELIYRLVERSLEGDEISEVLVKTWKHLLKVKVSSSEDSRFVVDEVVKHLIEKLKETSLKNVENVLHIVSEFLDCFEDGNAVFRRVLEVVEIQNFSVLTWSSFVHSAFLDRGLIACSIPPNEAKDKVELSLIEANLVKTGCLLAKIHQRFGSRFDCIRPESILHLLVANTFLETLENKAVKDVRFCRALVSSTLETIKADVGLKKDMKEALSLVSHLAHTSKSNLLVLACCERPSWNLSVDDVLAEDTSPELLQVITCRLANPTVCEELIKRLNDVDSLGDRTIKHIAAVTSALIRIGSSLESSVVTELIAKLMNLKKLADNLDYGKPAHRPSKWNPEEFNFHLAILHCLNAIVKVKAAPLTSPMWDFVLCTASDSLDVVKDIVHQRPSGGYHPKDLVYGTHVVELLASVCQLMKELFDGKQSSGNAPNLLKEWDEFFAEHISEVLYDIYVQAVDVVTDLQDGGGHQLIHFPLHQTFIKNVSFAFSVLHPAKCPSKALNSRMTHYLKF